MAIKSRNKVSIAFSMSSMTDIVFLLLIFFIVLSTMVMPYGENVDLPNSDTRIVDKANIAVSIQANLQYTLDGSPISRAALESALVAKAKLGTSPHVVLYVDESVPTGETINFLSIVKKHGLGIVIATERP